MSDNHQTRSGDVNPEATRAALPEYEDASTEDLGRISSEAVFEVAPEDTLEIHAAAATYPVLPDQRDKMIESIRANGQIDPVTVYRGQILDGRTRTLACKALGIALKCRQIVDLDGLEPLEWVVRRNQAAGMVRHLSDSQRAMIAAELCVQVYQPQAEERRRQGAPASETEKGLASEKAAKVVNVTTNRVRQALKVHARNWERLRNAVWSGQVGISTAAKIANLSDQKDRKRALTAAEQKNQVTLREILNKRTLLRDGLGRTVDSEIRLVFDTASTWNTHIAALRRVSTWLKDSVEEPAARVLKRQLSPKAVMELIDRILASQPWCQCPYCDQFSGAPCQVCHGSGWLTESEYHSAMKAAASLLACSFQEENSQEERKG